MAYAIQTRRGEELNRLYPEDLPVHEWYRFVLSYPPHLVRDYLKRFGLEPDQTVLDPFCGTGTTLVECKKVGVPSVGLEANPVVEFAARTKTRWDVDPDGLMSHAREIADTTRHILSREGVEDEPFFQIPPPDDEISLQSLSPEQERLVITNSISSRPLHKVLRLLEVMEGRREDAVYDYERLALAKQLVYSISNLRFGPEVGVGKQKEDAPVVGPWLLGVRNMSDDLRGVGDRKRVPTKVHLADARGLSEVLEPGSIDAVITSPPYPNEKDYTRTTRLESVLLGFLNSRDDLRQHKRNLLRSNTRTVYKKDEDEQWVVRNATVQALADAIETRRLELGKTSGFERLYARVVRLYFGGMARHLEELKRVLRPGAQLAYVVGDQASYFRVLIRTGEVLAEIAESLGYEVVGIDLFRTRFSTATQQQLREEVVLLRWN
ncbi:MAG TPA: DNA methyltransferase [Rhodothermales bacterium]|nr:DNA methyltransferase [Rhodothermales bacterium]